MKRSELKTCGQCVWMVKDHDSFACNLNPPVSVDKDTFSPIGTLPMRVQCSHFQQADQEE